MSQRSQEPRLVHDVSLLLLLLDTRPEAVWVVLGIDLMRMILRLGCLVIRVGVGGYLVTKDIVFLNIA